MKFIDHLPIKWKIISILLVISFTTLIFACTIFAINDLRLFKANMIRNLSVLAEAVGQNNTAAISFEVKDEALQILSSLKAEPQVYHAVLYTQDGGVFVQYKPRPLKQINAQKSKGFLSNLIDDRVEIRRPILLNERKIGEILIKAELSEYQALLGTYTFLIFLIVATTLAISLIVSIKLQAIISKPILHLAQTANQLSEEHNYSVRVNHTNKDEIGTLYSGFNEMLSQIEKRDKDLEDYRTHLEEKVVSRTRELSHANQNLRRSVQEKDILLGETHHRVKNNFQIISSLLRLQASHPTAADPVEVFRECSQRVDSMALLYEKIYSSKDISEIKFEEYLSELVSGLLIAYGIKDNSITVDIDTHSILLNIDSIVPCGLIVQELVSNSLKYAFQENAKGHINISLKNSSKNNNTLDFEVSDNGAGLPTEIDIFKTETLGLQLVTRLAKNQLNGDIKIINGEGTQFIINFPRKSHDDRN